MITLYLIVKELGAFRTLHCIARSLQLQVLIKFFMQAETNLSTRSGQTFIDWRQGIFLP